MALIGQPELLCHGKPFWRNSMSSDSGAIFLEEIRTAWLTYRCMGASLIRRFGHYTAEAATPVQLVYTNSDDEVREGRRGNDLQSDPRTYSCHPRQILMKPRALVAPTCPVSHQVFEQANQLAFHYEAEHAIWRPGPDHGADFDAQ